MSEPVGTLGWTRTGGGALTPAESRALFVELLSAQLKIIPEEWMHRLGLRRPCPSGLTPQDLVPPDSESATAAAEACRAASQEYLFNHCARSYGWARIFGAHIGANPDPELLYVAAMFHDIGLTEAHGSVDERPACFSMISADEAAKTLAQQNWDESRIDRVCEAITLHLNIGVDLRYGPEAHLLNLATALDTTGLRKWRVTAEELAMVLDRHPRLDQNESLAACWHAEAKRFPHARAGWLERNVKFSGRLRKAPFDTA